MKTHELAILLENISTLLKSMPNGNILDSVESLQKLLDEKNKSKPTKNRSNTIPPNIPNQFIEELYKSTIADAEKKLTTDPLFISTASIASLANLLNIETSKRQNRSAIINSIIRHLEARKMGSIIRNDTTTESKATE